jgi:O-antigen ligase
LNWLVPIVMFGWIPLILAAFRFLPARRAVLGGFLIGWLFLPIAQYPIAGLPDYTKLSAVCGVVLAGAALFDFRRFLALRPAWIDAPVLLFCLSPFASSISNDLGLHDGLSAVFAQALRWGAPYLLGRLYFSGVDPLGELACAIFGGALVYAPLVLVEVWRGPVLHELVFGYAQPMTDSIPRFGGLRPIVFMESSLMLAVWMAAGAVIGLWLWRSHARMPPRWLLPLAIAATLLMRSVNGWFMLALGTALLFLTAMLRTKIVVTAVIGLILVFLAVRTLGVWSGRQVVTVVSAVINPVRAESLAFRFKNEQIIGDNARRRPILGWGRQARPFYNIRTGRPAVPDSLWIAVFAESGLMGLVGFMALLLSPVVRFLRLYAATDWTLPEVAPAAALAVVLILYTIDLLFNAFANPVFMLAAGGLAGLSPLRLPDRNARYSE